jgi:hypothetical protein
MMQAASMHYLEKFPRQRKADVEPRRNGAMRVNTNGAPATATAHLHGDDICSALGIEAHGPSPLLMLCRALIAAGVEPSTSLAAYRGDTLALKVRAIGEAAGLEVAPHGVGFIRAPKRRRASLASRDEGAASRAPTAGAS